MLADSARSNQHEDRNDNEGEGQHTRQSPGRDGRR